MQRVGLVHLEIAMKSGTFLILYTVLQIVNQSSCKNGIIIIIIIIIIIKVCKWKRWESYVAGMGKNFIIFQ